ncbi:MAG: ATP-binding protein [Gammaproteobacteria bacterium]|nr:ATP-binding protein [Gammaproteobacteria bacterium]
MYRFVQEVLTNAVRHADASAIDLIVSVTDGVLRLTVTDDGRGFEPEACRDALGIVSMEERVLSLGGRFTLESALGEGTLVAMECALGGAAGAPPRRCAAQGG